MEPHHRHWHFEVSSRAGVLPMRIVVEPGAQGPAGIGMHGCGVSTPIAAEVAAATNGFAIAVHIPKGRILVIGMLSKIVAAGGAALTLCTGRTDKVLGTSPNEQFKMAPEVTTLGMVKTMDSD